MGFVRQRNMYIFIFILFFTRLLPVDGLDFPAHGFNLISKSNRDNQVVYRVKDDEGIPVSIVSTDEPDPSDLERVAFYHKRFSDWRYMQVASMTFVFYENELEINIMPESYIYEGVDFTRYISSGLGFYYTNVLEYNFRLYINNNYPRLKGRFFSEQKLSEKILAVVESPEAAVKSAAEHNLDWEGADTSDELNKVIGSMKQEIASLRNTQASLQAKVDTLQRENQNLHGELAKMRRAVLVLHNLGIFGNINTVSINGIERIKALKEEDPDIMQEEAARILNKEGIPMSAHEIFLVYSLYFNEFK